MNLKNTSAGIIKNLFYNRLNIILGAFIFIGFSQLANAQDLENLKSKKPFSIHGSLGATSTFYSRSDTLVNAVPFSWMLTGNFNASLYGIDLPFSFVLSEKDRSYRQPFNQFGLSPHYKWFTAQLGYRCINYSSYTLAGFSILGAGFDMNPGKLRLGFMYGRFNRATGFPENGINATPSYKRNGFSFKAGYGSPGNFFDFIFLKAQDDSTSLKRDTNHVGINPASNIVVGYNTKFTLAKGFTFESEAALSVYTSDTKMDSLKETVNNTVKLFNGIMPVNITSESKPAIKAALAYKIKKYSLKLQYQRVAPGYKSMGVYYINNDFQNITIEPAINFQKQKLNIRGSIGIQQDNLSKVKKATSARTIGSAGLSWNPVSKFGINVNYSNLTTAQKAGNIPLVDTSKIYQSNQSLTVSPRLILTREKNIHSVALVYSYLVMNDHNSKTADMTEFNINNAILAYSMAAKDGSSSINFGLNYSGFNRKTINTKLYGFSAGYGKLLLKKQLNLNVPLSVMKSVNPGQNSLIISLFPSATYILHEKHFFSFQFSYIANYAGSGNAGTFNEIKADISYRYNF